MKATDLPFEWLTPVSGAKFLKPKKEFKKLSKAIKHGQNAVVTGSRGTGKTTIIRLISQNVSHRVTTVDLSWAIEPAEAFVMVVNALKGKVVSPVESVFESTYGSSDLNTLKEENESIPFETLADPGLLVLDNLPSHWSVGQLFQWQGQMERFKKDGLITNLLYTLDNATSTANDLLLQLQKEHEFIRVPLDKLNRENWSKFLIDRFATCAQLLSFEEALGILNWCGNNAGAIQEFSYWLHILGKHKFKTNQFQKAITRLLNSRNDAFHQRMSKLSVTQRNFILASRKGTAQLSSAQNLALFNLGTSANVVKVKRTLMERGIIREDGEIADEVFGHWIDLHFRGVVPQQQWENSMNG